MVILYKRDYTISNVLSSAERTSYLSPFDRAVEAAGFGVVNVDTLYVLFSYNTQICLLFNLGSES